MSINPSQNNGADDYNAISDGIESADQQAINTLPIAGQVTIKNVPNMKAALSILSDLYVSGLLNQNNYLITGGYAVQLITEVKRSHENLDLIVFNKASRDKLNEASVDIVTFEDSQSYINLGTEFLARTRKMRNRYANSLPIHLPIANPAISFVQKCTTAFRKEPVQSDLFDAASMLMYISQRPETEKIAFYMNVHKVVGMLFNGYKLQTVDRINAMYKALAKPEMDQEK